MAHQPFFQQRVTHPRLVVVDGEGFLCCDDDDELLAAGDAGIEQVALQQYEVLYQDRYDHHLVVMEWAMAIEY